MKIIKVSLLLALISAIFIHPARATYIDYLDQKVSDKPIKLTANKTVGQTFIATEDNLVGIKIRFGTYNKTIDDTIVLRLKELNQEDWLVEEKYNTQPLADNQFFLLPFSKVKNIENLEMYFELESLTGREDNAVAVWSAEDNQYEDGFAFIDSEEYPETDLNFILVTEKPFRKTVTRDFINKLEEQRPFFIIYSLMLIFISGLIIKGI